MAAQQAGDADARQKSFGECNLSRVYGPGRVDFAATVSRLAINGLSLISRLLLATKRPWRGPLPPHAMEEAHPLPLPCFRVSPTRV